MQEPYNLDFLKADVVSYVDSGQYYSDIKTKMLYATNVVNENISNPNACVIFDIDETLISEYQFMLKNNFAWTDAIIEEAQSVTTFPAIPSVKGFFDHCVNKEIFTIVLTSRRIKYLDSTMELLSNTGYLTLGRLIMRPDDDVGTIQQFKKYKRDMLVKEGYDIILNIGDQDSDLVDTQPMQQLPVNEVTEGNVFSQNQNAIISKQQVYLPPNAVKLPNPFYYISCYV